jgi:hypothetical protein
VEGAIDKNCQCEIDCAFLLSGLIPRVRPSIRQALENTEIGAAHRIAAGLLIVQDNRQPELP